MWFLKWWTNSILCYAPYHPGWHIIDRWSMLLLRSESSELLTPPERSDRHMTQQMVIKSLCASHHCTLISQTETAVIQFYVDHSAQTKQVHVPFNKDRLLAVSEACLLTRKSGKNGSRRDCSPQLQQQHYQVAQKLDRHQVQRIASKR